MTDVKTLDIRWTNSSTRRELAFVAVKPNLPTVSAGHAFVRIMNRDSGGNVLSTSSFGLYPDPGEPTKGILGPVPSQIVTDDWKSKGDVYLEILISDKQYELVNATVQHWSGGTYSLVHDNCATFTLAVATNLMMKVPPKAGNPLSSLPYILIQKLAQINSQKDFLGGEWESSDSGKRWKIDIRDVSCTHREQGSTASPLIRELPLTLETFDLTGATQSSWRIERPNDQEVLTFLGAKPNIVPAILGRSPKPSYSILKRKTATEAELTWFGLLWKLNAGGDLTGIDQPGSKPGKVFQLKRKF